MTKEHFDIKKTLKIDQSTTMVAREPLTIRALIFNGGQLALCQTIIFKTLILLAAVLVKC